MKTSYRFKIVLVRTTVLIAAVTLGACNTNPTVSSSGTPSSIPPAGTPSSTPSSIPSSTPSSSPSTSTSSGNQTGTQSPTSSSPAGQGQSQSAGTQAGDSSSSSQQAGTGQQGNKTDDQILAEALEEFGRKNQSAGQGEEGSQGNSQTAGTETGEGNGALTDAEKSAKLDRQLDEKFAKFDNIILGEREGVNRADNEQGVGGGSDSYGTGAGGGEEEPLQTAMNEPPQQGASHGGIKSRLPSHSVSQDVPDDVGAGQDDDIIARQLREAAMKERDPELRAKLWDEYRKYKKGS